MVLGVTNRSLDKVCTDHPLSKDKNCLKNLAHSSGAKIIQISGGFPGGTVVENLPANAGGTGSSPGLGRSHMPRSN